MASVEIVEVGPRDGLQNDPAELDTATKVEFIRRVAAAGVRRAEVASFVNPARVPRMADADAVVAATGELPTLRRIGLVLNRRGFERARATGIEEVNCVVVASDTFSQRNQGMTTEAAMQAAEEVASAALLAGVRPTVTLSAAFGCPYEGEVAPRRVLELVVRAAAAGMQEIALADTIGVATPSAVGALVEAAADIAGEIPLRAHFHNTRNTGYANALTAARAGVRALDASLGGIGGCPFAPRATGNIATEDLVWALERDGIATGVDLGRLLAAAEWLEGVLERQLPGLVHRAGVFPPAAAAAG